MLIALDGLGNDLLGGVRAGGLVDIDRLVLQRAIDLEEVAHFLDEVRREVGDVVIGVIGRVGEGDGDDLFVLHPIVHHGDDADRVAPHERQRVERFRTQHEHIERVAVGPKRLGDEAVIGRVVRRGVQHAVEDDIAGFLVQLVFLFAALADLDHADEVLGRDAPGVQVVPDVVHGKDPFRGIKTVYFL